MSRFALIVRSETVTGAERVELFRKMLYRRPKPIKDIQKFDQWVQMAREFVPIFEVSKEIEDKYIEYCSRIVDEHLDKGSHITLGTGLINSAHTSN